jgi:hypothetical protein
MRKRLRKKLRFGEFREDAFGVRYTLRPGLSEAERDAVLDRFIEQAVDANQLRCAGGGGSVAWEFQVMRVKRGSPTEAQRAAVGAWLGAQPEIASYALGGFFDCWHGREEPPFPPAEPVSA